MPPADPGLVALPRSRRAIAAALYLAAMFVTILDSTIVNVAIPSIRVDLGVSTGAVEWVVTGYLLGLAVMVPISGWLSDRVGSKRLFVAALGGFTVASAWCAWSPSIGALLAGRVVQGMCGGLLTTLALAMLFRAYPPQERARVSRILVIPTAVAPACGPLLGGWLVEQHTWPWIFLVNVPIGIVAIVVAIAQLDADPPAVASGRPDLAALALVGGGLAAVLYGLNTGALDGWLEPRVLLAGVLGSTALVAFVRRERRAELPVLDLELWRDRLFRSTSIVMACSSGAFLGIVFVLPLYLQEFRGSGPIESGTTTFTEALGVVALSQVVSRLYPQIGPRRLMTFGMLAMAVLLASYATLDATSSLWTVRVLMFLTGAAFAFVLVPLQAASFTRIAPPSMGRASALFTTSRQLASAVGVAVLATALLALGDDDRLRGFRAAFLLAAAIAAVGAVAATRIRDEDAAASMERARR